jgi:4-amino-4-deoxy-L-arabinose transferase-like glycosyltransferase
MQNNRLLSGPLYWILWLGLAAVYGIGLFVPLLDSDASHHALIALHFLESGDYVSLVDRGMDYLDKPHLLFWTAALSYKVFGINTFAFKFPSLLASILGFYSTYRLGKLLYDEPTGRVAALIHGAACAQLLANQDVRMDAMLTAFVIFSTWMLFALVRTAKRKYALGGALGLALAFATKGGIGVAVPVLAVGIQLVFEKNLRALLRWHWVLVGVSFLVFVAPVLYAYYVQFDLHPEKEIRGMTGLSGIRFILLGQSVERFQGEAWGSSGSTDYFFFFHTLLWAFLPWSLLFYWGWIRGLIDRKGEFLTTGICTLMLVVLAFAQYKLPHYLNILFPFMAILVSGRLTAAGEKTIRTISWVQTGVAVILIAFGLYLNLYIQPIPGRLNQAVAIGIAGVVLFLCFRQAAGLPRILAVSVGSLALVFFSLSANVYPHFAEFDSGYTFARDWNKRPADEPLSQFHSYSYTFDFYTKKLHPPLPEGVLPSTPWVLTDSTGLSLIRKAGIRIDQIQSHPHFHVSVLSGEFLNPATRLLACERRYLLRLGIR